jgi:uncharacterized protein (DUF58 family)
VYAAGGSRKAACRPTTAERGADTLRGVRNPIALLLLAVALAVAAASVASLALFAVAIGLALVTMCAGVAVAVATRRLTVGRTVSHHEAQEGDPIHLRFHVQGITWLPALLEARNHSGTWVGLSPASATVELTVPRPGAYQLAPSRLRLRDALGIFKLHVRAGRQERLLILPAPGGAAGDHSRLRATFDDPEPDGVRPYAPGTPLARIDWTALARGVGLQVRHFSAGPSGTPLVVVDTAGAPNSRALDWTARTAAGYILALARGGGCRVLLPGDASETSITDVDGEWPAIHRRLATLAPSAMTVALPSGGHATAIHVRAAMAPPCLAPARPLPPDVVPLATRRA